MYTLSRVEKELIRCIMAFKLLAKSKIALSYFSSYYYQTHFILLRTSSHPTKYILSHWVYYLIFFRISSYPIKNVISSHKAHSVLLSVFHFITSKCILFHEKYLSFIVSSGIKYAQWNRIHFVEWDLILNEIKCA